jgi:hypothetical protein
MVNEVNEKRREFLRASGQLVSGLVVAGSAMATPPAAKEPAVIGYPNRKGVTIERVTHPARNTGTTIVARARAATIKVMPRETNA